MSTIFVAKPRLPSTSTSASSSSYDSAEEAEAAPALGDAARAFAQSSNHALNYVNGRQFLSHTTPSPVKPGTAAGGASSGQSPTSTFASKSFTTVPKSSNAGPWPDMRRDISAAAGGGGGSNADGFAAAANNVSGSLNARSNTNASGTSTLPTNGTPTRHVDVNARLDGPLGRSAAFARSDTMPATPRRDFFDSATPTRGGGHAPQPQSSQHIPVLQNTAAVATTSWAETLALSFLTCAFCHEVVDDPVQVMPDPLLACRHCALARNATASDGAATPDIRELPHGVVSTMREVLQRAGLSHEWLRKLHPNENDVPILKRRAANHGRNNGGGVNNNNNESASALSSPGRRRSASDEDGGLSAHPVTMTTVTKQPPAAAAATAAVVGASSASPTTPPPSTLSSLLAQLVEAEGSERAQISAAQLKAWAELERQAKLRRQRAAAAGPTSRQLKVEADRLYEATHYARALELYTRAIELQAVDKLTQLKFLYGNRSAANFMAHHYAECVADCLAVVRLEPENTKMLSRAARAAATMGDLAQAVSIMEGTAKERVTEAMQNELVKYRQGLEILQKVDKLFGTPQGDEQLRMLIAQFAETVPFRVRYAESLMRQKQYMRALEPLEVVSASVRPPAVAKLMAECLYLSGFEHFDRAKRILKDHATSDEACGQLLRLIERVDEGKQSGNNNFAQKNFSAAVADYTGAIQYATGNDQILRILYCNRAAANKEIGRYREGVEDCTRTLAIDPDFFKAYARRARCHQHLGDNFAAVQDFKKALQYESGDHELAKELRTAELHLAKEAEKEKDYYYQLGVTRNATDREIKAKYRELSLRWHPDKCVGLGETEKQRAEHKFKVISEAYAALIDPVKRREFDLKTDRERFSRGAPYMGAASAFNANTDYFRGARHRSGPGGYW